MDVKLSHDLKIGFIPTDDKKFSDNQSYNASEKPVDQFIDILDQKADIQMAYNHGLADRIYKINYQKIKETPEIENTCKCCGKFIPDDNNLVSNYPYCTYIGSVANDVGVGIYLYLYYIRLSIALLFFSFAISGFFQLQSLSSMDYQIKKYCNYNKTSHSCEDFKKAENGKKYIISNQFYLNLTYYILNENNLLDVDEIFKPNYLIHSFLLMIVIYFFGYIQFVVEINRISEFDIENTSTSDYTLMISNLPTSECDIDYLRKCTTFGSITPQILNPAYKLDEYFLLKTEYLETQKKISICQSTNSLIYKSFLRNELLVSLKAKLNQIEVRMSELANTYKNHALSPTIFSRTGFITFDTIMNSSDYLEEFPNTSLGHIMSRIKMYLVKYIFFKCYTEDEINRIEMRDKYEVIRAPEPDDIIWQNLQFLFMDRFIRYIIVNIISFLIVIGGFVPIFFLTKYQISSDQDRIAFSGSLYEKYFISCLITFVIVVINNILDKILFYITDYEKNRTFTDFYLSQSIKQTFLTFVNTAITPFLVCYLGDFKKDREYLINNLVIIFLSNAIITPCLYLFPPYYYYQCLLRKRLLMQSESKIEINMTQREANEIFENPSINIAYKYSYITKTVLMSYFYLPFFPLGSVFSFFGLLLVFFIERHNILRFYKIPETLNDSICIFYMKVTQGSLFVLAIGNLIFVRNLDGSINEWNYINLIVAFLLLPIPFEYMVPNLLGITEDEINPNTYDSVYLNLQEDYERANPITKKQGLQKFIKVLRDNDLITSENYLLLMEDIDNKHSLNFENYYSQNKSLKTNIENNKQNKFLSMVTGNISKQENRKTLAPHSKNMLKTFNMNVDKRSQNSYHPKNTPKFNLHNANNVVNHISEDKTHRHSTKKPMLKLFQADKKVADINDFKLFK